MHSRLAWLLTLLAALFALPGPALCCALEIGCCAAAEQDPSPDSPQPLPANEATSGCCGEEPEAPAAAPESSDPAPRAICACAKDASALPAKIADERPVAPLLLALAPSESSVAPAPAPTAAPLTFRLVHPPDKLDSHALPLRL